MMPSTHGLSVVLTGDVIEIAVLGYMLSFLRNGIFAAVEKRLGARPKRVSHDAGNIPRRSASTASPTKSDVNIMARHDALSSTFSAKDLLFVVQLNRTACEHLQIGDTARPFRGNACLDHQMRAKRPSDKRVETRPPRHYRIGWAFRSATALAIDHPKRGTPTRGWFQTIRDPSGSDSVSGQKRIAGITD